MSELGKGRLGKAGRRGFETRAKGVYEFELFFSFSF
jgi:hypothetical protein